MSTNHIYPAKYWRQNKEWSRLLGRRGRVIAVTTIRVAAPAFQASAPYDLALVELESQEKSGSDEDLKPERVELMACYGEKVVAGNKVKIVLRRQLWGQNKSGLISYQLRCSGML